jgi:TolB-like protein/AraC-like DNA-binding protein
MSAKDFMDRLAAVIAAEMHNPQFGVGELADRMSMSRSSLLRQVKKNGLPSVNQLIKETRLKKAVSLLKEDQLNISQISFEVGFSSPSYFIKCFKDEYGYSPGAYEPEKEERKEVAEEVVRSKSKWSSIGLGLLVTLVVVTAIWVFSRAQEEGRLSKSSIAVLPFINESLDSTKLYLVNGMMESILTNLQRLNDVRVISRSSVERFRHAQLSHAEIVDALDVDYLVEGSVQLYKQEMLLSVQLIDGEEDNQLWSDQYRRNVSDLFDLQAEVSQKIVEAIQITLTPEIKEEFNKKPTSNNEAYQAYLQGVEWTTLETDAGLDSAIGYFQQAIALDAEFATAHAYLAICYYYKDIFKLEKEFREQMLIHADRAVLLDAKAPVSLISKALYYMQEQQYEEAEDYFKRVIKYSPNSATAHNYLAEIYTSYLPDIEKYLIHILTASKLDLTGNDSTALSYTHLHLANAFAQSGIIDRAKSHIHQSLAYNPENIFSNTLAVYIDLAQDMDFENARNRLQIVYKMDTARLDVMQELAKTSYTMRDYKSAATYYRKFMSIKQMYGLQMYKDEDVLIAYVLRTIGDTATASVLMESYDAWVAQDQSIYKSLHQAFSAIYHGHEEDAMTFMKAFSRQENIMYWVPAFLGKDPLFMELSDQPGYDQLLNDLNQRFEKDKNRRIQKLIELDLY